MSLLSELAKTGARYGVATRKSRGGLTSTVVGLVATRIATRSVPGALLVGGAMLGKYLWDKRKERDALNAVPPMADVPPTSTAGPKPASQTVIDQ